MDHASKFVKAAGFVNDKSLKGHVPFKPDQQKQSPQPYAVQILSRAKWDAHNSYKGLSQSEAEQRYVEEVLGAVSQLEGVELSSTGRQALQQLFADLTGTVPAWLSDATTSLVSSGSDTGDISATSASSHTGSEPDERTGHDLVVAEPEQHTPAGRPVSGSRRDGRRECKTPQTPATPFGPLLPLSPLPLASPAGSRLPSKPSPASASALAFTPAATPAATPAVLGASAVSAASTPALSFTGLGSPLPATPATPATPDVTTPLPQAKALSNQLLQLQAENHQKLMALESQLRRIVSRAANVNSGGGGVAHAAGGVGHSRSSSVASQGPVAALDTPVPAPGPASTATALGGGPWTPNPASAELRDGGYGYGYGYGHRPEFDHEVQHEPNNPGLAVRPSQVASPTAGAARTQRHLPRGLQDQDQEQEQEQDQGFGDGGNGAAEAGLLEAVEARFRLKEAEFRAAELRWGEQLRHMQAQQAQLLDRLQAQSRAAQPGHGPEALALTVPNHAPAPGKHDDARTPTDTGSAAKAIMLIGALGTMGACAFALWRYYEKKIQRR